MGFELERSLRDGAACVSTWPFIGSTLRNPVYTSLLITALAMVIIFLQFGMKGVSGRQMLRAGFYAFIGTSLLVYLHYYALAGALRQSDQQSGIRDVMGSIYGHGAHPDAYRVEPRSGGTNGGYTTGGQIDVSERLGGFDGGYGGGLTLSPVPMPSRGNHIQ